MYRYETATPSPDVLERLQEALGSAYVIERELGGGGMSRIFLAREVALGRRVVVKLLPPEYAAGVNGERFRHEILLAARLQHPHIVPILSAGEMNGVPYYTMPFIDGESLRWRLMRGDRLRVADVTRILHDIIDALAYAHEHGVVHRDIKPDNVLMSRQHAVISDFGVAKALDAAQSFGDENGAPDSEHGMAIGTPAYMAPEQAAADPSTDHRADLYGFGVLAYELLTGQPVFSGREPLELLAAHVAETPIPILALRPDVPAPLADLVMRCLEKHPDLRPASAAEVRDALESLGSLTEVIPLAPPAPRFMERVSRLAAAIVLAVVGTGGALLHLAGEGSDRTPVVADAPDARRPDAAKPRPQALGPALVDAYMLGKRQVELDLPAVVAAEPDVPVLAAAPTKKSVKRGSRVAVAQAASADPEVHVELRAKHGSARVVVSSLDNAKQQIETMARRIQAFEAMAGPDGAVLAAVPAVDSITLERNGSRMNATVFVNATKAPRGESPRPRSQAPDGSAASLPSAPAAPAPARTISMTDVNAALERAAPRQASVSECAEQAARRLREQAARAKNGATS